MKHHLHAFNATVLTILFAGHPVLADDTEVLLGSGGQAWSTPNVLFIMDTSGSMANDINGRSPTKNNPSRLSIVQGVFADLMNDSSYHGMNIGLMRFDRDANGGYFVSPMQALNFSTSAGIVNESNNFTANGYTPLAETLYEAARFYGGLSVDYGDNSAPGTNTAAVMDVDITASGYIDNTAKYLSPITSHCQKNYIILLTDGEPRRDGGADNSPRIPDLPGYNSGSCNFNATPSNDCLDEVADYLYTVDQNTNIDGIQTVDTYTIGFTTDQVLLDATARAGGGKTTKDSKNDHYITADNDTELANAFKKILNTIPDTNNSFSPPALAANTFSGISHYNTLYFALFEPDTKPKWNGNIKPYTLSDNYQITSYDSNPNDTNPAEIAIDGNGFFKINSQSLWSSASDGVSIIDGGANDQLPPVGDRKLYTFTGDYDKTTGQIPDSLLTQFKDSNTNLTRKLLGIDPNLSTADATAVRATIINNIRGDRILGAPLHSQPALITYGGSKTEPDITLFVATNDGFLHAIDARTHDAGLTNGREKFAFIPKELLKNLEKLDDKTGNHSYGLDGAITAWVKDINKDRTIDSSVGDRVYIYVGMRRGGNNYYALDVTNRDAPTLKWVIRGGKDGSTGFGELGQTWSKPALTTIKDGKNGSRTVLIFGGGYDTNQDSNPVDKKGNVIYGTPDKIGRAVYIVDAETGVKLWQAGANPAKPKNGSNPDLHIPDMTHSIPSDIALLDSDFDGHTDRLYFGDMYGQIFRIDLQTTSGITGSPTLLASLGGDTADDNRRFYYPPDLVHTRKNSATYVSINIGSGYRAHPLNPLNADGTDAPRVEDQFYSLRDNIGTSGPTIYESNLFDATFIPVLTDQDTIQLTDAATRGWRITLGNGSGEKVLASAITLNSETFFTTYTPPASIPAPKHGTSCAPPTGTGRMYRVSLFDASPITDQNNDSDAEDLIDRIKNLNHPGIPPAPTLTFHKKSNGDIAIARCIGTECEELPDSIRAYPAYWKNED